VVIVDLPDSQKLVVVEGWLTDSIGNQPIRITRSNGFSNRSAVEIIENAQVSVQSKSGDTPIDYTYESNGYYFANSPYRGSNGVEYRVSITLDTLHITSEWDKMPNRVSIESLLIDSFEENDPDNSNQQITIFYPKVTSRDPENETNFYRWVFYKNGSLFNEPDPITIQNDRFFNGNLIPNNFQNFDYDSRDEMNVRLYSTSESAYNYLKILKSQITTLGTSSGTTPAIINGNLYYENQGNQRVLGFFGAVAVSNDTAIVP
jgi:hypothetical protein